MPSSRVQTDSRLLSACTLSSSLLDGVQAQQAESWRRLGRLFAPQVYRWARQAGLDEPLIRPFPAGYLFFPGSSPGMINALTRSSFPPPADKHARQTEEGEDQRGGFGDGDISDCFAEFCGETDFVEAGTVHREVR